LNQKGNSGLIRGNHPARVDEKGRLKVPVEFKRVIDEKYGTQFYITSLDGKIAEVYPFEEWERIEQKLASLSTSNPTKKEFLDRVRYGHRVKMDGRGRLLIPQLLREAAQIKGEVAVIGNLTHLIVRNLWAYRKEIEEQQRGFSADSDAPVFAPLKPRPHLRSGAIALPEPTHPDDALTEIKAIRISK
jgi:MraZ protein